METLNVKDGDILEIQAKRKTVAKCKRFVELPEELFASIKN